MLYNDIIKRPKIMKTKTKVEDMELYNEKVKNRFLEKYQEGTEIAYRRVLALVKPQEDKLQKDVYEMNKEELDGVLYTIKAKNEKTMETYARVLSGYINWAIDNGITDVNHLSSYRPSDFMKFVDEEVYYNERMLRNIENLMENYQDMVITRLVFEGVGGKGYSELLNLKESDIDFETNTLRLFEEIGENKVSMRKLQVSHRAMDIIKGAINQTIYVKRNGQAEGKGNYMPLTDSDYVLKNAITNVSGNLRMETHTVYYRVKVIEAELGLKDFRLKFIQRSGVIQKLSDSVEDPSNITPKDIKRVAGIFNIRSVGNIKSYATEENVKKCRKR